MGMTEIYYLTRAKLSLRRAHVHNILRTADALSRSGYAVTVVSTELFGDERAVREQNGVMGPFRMMRDKSLARFLFRERSGRAVCYVRDPGLWSMALLARMLGYRVVVELHGNRESVGKRVMFPLLYRVSHGALFITERLREWYGATAKSAKRKPYAVIPCVGLRDDEIIARDIFDYRAVFGIGSEKILAVYLGGGAGKYYDMSLLVRALPCTDERVVMIIVGLKEEERAGLRLTAEHMGVAERLYFQERFFPAETLSYARGADILVSPKVWAPEGGVSAKYYAYLAAGRVIIATDTTTDREVLDDACAVLVEATPEAFGSAMTELACDDARRTRMGAHGLKRAEAFSERVRTERVIGVIQKVLI